jgi:CRISPR-associated protein Cmr6
MRERLRKVLRAQWGQQVHPPSHAGLAYERWAWPRPRAEDRANQPEWDDWLHWLEGFQAPQGYHLALERWRRALGAEPHTRQASFQATSRLLVGHGNPSGTEVGLTLHHTWGVPVVPGSALKGLTAHYVRTVYGPVEPSHPEPERLEYGGGLRDANGQPRRGPGTVYRLLFGAPELEGPQEHASQGRILFQDALWLPPEGPGRGPLARDVLTVHQRNYYAGKESAWPNDYDSPNPVSFLTVAPGTRFRVALGVVPGPHAEELLDLAWRFLGEALWEWGVGGKSSVGYGRLKSLVLEEFQAWLQEPKERKVLQRTRLEQVKAEWLPRLLALPLEERTRAAGLLRTALNSRKLQQQLASLTGQLCTSET